MITGIRRPGSDCCCCSCAAADNTRNSKWLPSKGGTLLGLSTETIKSIPRSGIRNVWARLSCNYINWKYHSAQITAGLSAQRVFVRNVNCSQMASTGPHGPAVVVVVACLNFGQNSWLEKCKIIAVRLSFPLITWGLRLPSRGMPFYPHLFVRYRYDWSVFRNSAQLSSTLRLFFCFLGWTSGVLANSSYLSWPGKPPRVNRDKNYHQVCESERRFAEFATTDMWPIGAGPIYIFAHTSREWSSVLRWGICRLITIWTCNALWWYARPDIHCNGNCETLMGRLTARIPRSWFTSLRRWSSARDSKWCTLRSRDEWWRWAKVAPSRL